MFSTLFFLVQNGKMTEIKHISPIWLHTMSVASVHSNVEQTTIFGIPLYKSCKLSVGSFFVIFAEQKCRLLNITEKCFSQLHKWACEKIYTVCKNTSPILATIFTTVSDRWLMFRLLLFLTFWNTQTSCLYVLLFNSYLLGNYGCVTFGTHSILVYYEPFCLYINNRTTANNSFLTFIICIIFSSFL